MQRARQFRDDSKKIGPLSTSSRSQAFSSLFFSFSYLCSRERRQTEKGAQKNETQSQEEKKRDCISAPLTRMIRPENEPKEVNIKGLSPFSMTSVEVIILDRSNDSSRVWPTCIGWASSTGTSSRRTSSRRDQR